MAPCELRIWDANTSVSLSLFLSISLSQIPKTKIIWLDLISYHQVQNMPWGML